MSLPDQLFKPERYTYQDYLLWKGDWELINGYPYATAPSAIRNHQWFSSRFALAASKAIEQSAVTGNCQVFYGLDWIVDNETVVRPDCIVVCGNFNTDYLNYPPTLIVEISSVKTKLRDRNTKYDLYEMQGVKFYILADTENKRVEAFELVNGKYKPKTDTNFQLTKECLINFDVYSLWESM